jgi:hypothetical protein
VLVCILDTAEITILKSHVRIQNPELNMADWLTMSRKVTEKEQTLDFSSDPESYKALAKANLKAFWGLGRIVSGP